MAYFSTQQLNNSKVVRSSIVFCYSEHSSVLRTLRSNLIYRIGCMHCCTMLIAHMHATVLVPGEKVHCLAAVLRSLLKAKDCEPKITH